MENEKAPAGKRALDDLVVNTELTLISIIQGVALYFLTDTARQVVASGSYALYPYIVSGLLVIFLFWSRSIIHTFTVIRWPLEFGHNFLYIACTLLEALMFASILDVRQWYDVALAFTLLIWLLFAFDLRMIHKTYSVKAVKGANDWLDILLNEQRMNVRIAMPLGVAFYIGIAIAIRTYPDYFINRNGHIWFASAQLLGSVAYLVYVLGFYKKIVPLITRES